MTDPTPPPPASERPEHFFDPERGLPHDAILVRPSLWAGLSGILQLAIPLAMAAVPFLLFYVLFGRAPPEEEAPGLHLPDVLGFVYEFAFGLLAILIPAIRILFTRYAFGPDDLRVRRQVLERNEQRVEWQKVTALRYRRTLLDRVFGLERLDVVAYGRKGTTLNLVGLKKGSGFHHFVARKMREKASVAALFEND